MLEEHCIRSAAANWPDCCREWYWGKRLACIEIEFTHADGTLVDDLLVEAGEHKRPKAR